MTETPPQRGLRFGTRSLFVLITVIAIPLAGYAWLDRRFGEPRRQAQAVERRLESLAMRRPSSMSRRQWESAVAWTLNLHGNSLIMFQADASEIRTFDQKLAKRLSGNVDLETIHWIWDEYAKACPGGANYQKFRSHMDYEIKSGGGNWGMHVP